MKSSFATRLRELQGEMTGRSFAQRLGIPASTYRALLAGHSPTLDTLSAIREATGASIEWLATGDGPKWTAEIGRQSTTVPSVRFDPELLGRVVDRISRVYKDAGLRLQEIEKGRLAAEKYAEIADQADGEDEWPSLLDLMEVRLKKALQTAVNAPGQTKREA
jgi:transcriptional regulator with XRE-family HTH domain